MATDNSKNFSIISPDHPHRRLHILLSLLAIAVFAGSIIIFNLNKIPEDFVPLRYKDPTSRILTVMKSETQQNSPPEQIAAELKLMNEQIKKQKSTSDAETIRILKMMNEVQVSQDQPK